MILKHPELLVLPLFTEYVPGPLDGGKHYYSCFQRCNCWSFCTWSCCCKGCEVVHTNKVVISKEMSWTRMLYSSGFWCQQIATAVIYVGIDRLNALWWIINIMPACLDRLCFGITLHYSKSKGVSVIDNMGNIRSLSKEEAIYYNKVLQQRVNLQM